jgi:hypothetical protein
MQFRDPPRVALLFFLTHPFAEAFLTLKTSHNVRVPSLLTKVWFSIKLFFREFLSSQLFSLPRQNI